MKDLTISRMALSKDKIDTIDVYTDIYEFDNIYELKYQLWKIADIMDGLESRRFNNEYKEYQYMYYEVLKPNFYPRFNIIGIFHVKLAKEKEDEIAKAVSHLHMQSGTSYFYIRFNSKLS